MSLPLALSMGSVENTRKLSFKFNLRVRTPWST